MTTATARKGTTAPANSNDELARVDEYCDDASHLLKNGERVALDEFTALRTDYYSTMDWWALMTDDAMLHIGIGVISTGSYYGNDSVTFFQILPILGSSRWSVLDRRGDSIGEADSIPGALALIAVTEAEYDPEPPAEEDEEDEDEEEAVAIAA